MIIAGGGHTTSSILQSFFEIIALHPKVARRAHLDDVYRGQLIPKGAGVIPNLTALHHDEEMYPNPEIFDPERFKNHDLEPAASAVHPDHLQREHFNYGFGRRLCPGIHVAGQSLYIVISITLWGFDIEEKAGHALDMSAKSAGLIMKHEPFQVEIRSRGPMFSRIIREANVGLGSETEHQALDIDDVILPTI
ncbi:MAG: hypothetical protein LQ350_008154 [Teloschistes chrysophthalmus]|nr:MAG: hypothetical protein LQ350_008154 [Niorma chrysophthalma]